MNLKSTEAGEYFSRVERSDNTGNGFILERQAIPEQRKETPAPLIVSKKGVRIKRVSDVFITCLVILFINFWLLPLLAILIKITSRGPVFFVQWRTGRDNKPFRCIKLRSMYVNHLADLQQAQKNDPRITAAGRLLRKFSLDELPQFFNVLMGQMSVVGPRPHMIEHTSEFENQVDGYHRRLEVKPGITGLSQVLGYRGEIKEDTALAHRIRLDLFYIKKWSLWLDFKIILKTARLLVFGDKRAY